MSPVSYPGYYFHLIAEGTASEDLSNRRGVAQPKHQCSWDWTGFQRGPGLLGCGVPIICAACTAHRMGRCRLAHRSRTLRCVCDIPWVRGWCWVRETSRDRGACEGGALKACHGDWGGRKDMLEAVSEGPDLSPDRSVGPVPPIRPGLPDSLDCPLVPGDKSLSLSLDPDNELLLAVDSATAPLPSQAAPGSPHSH